MDLLAKELASAMRKLPRKQIGGADTPWSCRLIAACAHSPPGMRGRPREGMRKQRLIKAPGAVQQPGEIPAVGGSQFGAGPVCGASPGENGAPAVAIANVTSSRVWDIGMIETSWNKPLTT